MNRQQMFNMVAGHMFVQGQKAGVIVKGEPWQEEGETQFHCLYRDRAGRRCAVGALLKPEDFSWLWDHYGPDQEVTARDIFHDCSSFRNRLAADVTADFLAHLQHIHDTREPREWARELRSCALQNGLVVPAILRRRS